MLEVLVSEVDEHDIDSIFSSYINEILKSNNWKSGSITNRKIPWDKGLDAKTENADVFNSFGIYIWGGGHSPLYIGKTTTSFKKRFNRYIWSKRSQCKLAQDFGPSITKHGVDGFPMEIRDWYRRGYGNSTVRLNGSVRFAREDITSIWFTLLPIECIDDVAGAEKKLIQVAQAWNAENGFEPLLNIEFNYK